MNVTEQETRSSAGVTIAVACTATAMLMLDISVINTALSDIAHSLNTGLSGLQWIFDAYTLPLAAVVLTAGAVADRSGRRRNFLIGVLVFTAASAACGAAPSIEVLVAARAIQGLAAAMMFATSLALIGHVTPTPEERGKALAIYGATIGASFALGPFIGGSVVALVGWRGIFLINVPLGLVAAWITTRRVGESRDPHPRQVDWPGQATLIIGLFLLVYGLLRGNDKGWGSTAIVAVLAGGAAFLVAFAVIEHRSRAPMLPLRLFRSRVFTGAQVAVFSIAASFFAIFLYTTLYLQSVLGMSAIQTGLVYLPGTFLVFLVSGLTAQLSTRVSPARLAVVGLALIAAGIFVMLRTEVGSSWTVILPGLLLASIGTGVVNPSVSGIALSALPGSQSGLAAGAHDTFRQTGVCLGIAVLGALVPSADALGRNPQSYVDGLHVAMIVAAAIAAVGAVWTARLLLVGSPQPVGEEAFQEA